MSISVRSFLAVALLAAAFCCPQDVLAQSGDPKAGDKARQSGEAAKDAARKSDDLAEAANHLSGPAGNPECVWLGRRVVNLLWRDDLDTAFRHLDLYDRFGCPGRPYPGDFSLRRTPGKYRPEGAGELRHPGSCLLAQPRPSASFGGRHSARDRRNFQPVVALNFGH